ncbi:MAG: hypothetical protein JJU40_01970 [Rhodobacteraceae bacterium]|nr:hypothetical protein [Paracoccaceae bacterium]
MRIATFLAVIALTAAPSIAAAMCMDTRTTASQCGQGQVWDESAQACVLPATS